MAGGGGLLGSGSACDPLLQLVNTVIVASAIPFAANRHIQLVLGSVNTFFDIFMSLRRPHFMANFPPTFIFKSVSPLPS